MLKQIVVAFVTIHSGITDTDVGPWNIAIRFDEHLFYCSSNMLMRWIDVNGNNLLLYDDT